MKEWLSKNSFRISIGFLTVLFFVVLVGGIYKVYTNGDHVGLTIAAGVGLLWVISDLRTGP